MREYKRLSESEVERLILLYIGGSSMRRVGRELGVSQATVTWHLKKADIPIRSNNSYFEPKPLTEQGGRKKRTRA
jgi:hypothetical protein